MYRRRGSRMGCLTAVVLCRRAAIDWSSSLSCCTVSKPLCRRSSLLHRRRSSPWSYPLSPEQNTRLKLMQLGSIFLLKKAPSVR
ncbi:hypothetical protein HN51_025616 [Arachis hypogaea]